MLIRWKWQLVKRAQYSYLPTENLSKNLEKCWQIDTYSTLPKFNAEILPPGEKRVYTY